MKKSATFILGLLISVGMNSVGLVPMSAVFADENEYLVGTFAELLGVFDALSENETNDIARVSLSDDIVQTTGEGDYLGTSLGDTITLDLAGHTLTLRNDGVRGILNFGELIVTGSGTMTNYASGEEINGSYGLIDNYGGVIVIKDGTFLDYGQGGGAAIKNRTYNGVAGSLTIESANIHGYGKAAGNACVANDGVLAIHDGVTMENEATDEIYDGYYGAYCLVNNSGSAVIGATVGGSENPVTITGNRGGMGVNSGNVIINNGIFRGGKYYGMWITNNNNSTNVDIKYANVYGAKYGVYSSVDDGKQDLSDVGISIAGGKYAGGTKAAVAVNSSKSEHSFGMAITGGEFSTKPDDSYLGDGYVAGLTVDDNYPYMVVNKTDETDQYDVEYEVDEDEEEIPVIYPAQIEYKDEDAKLESKSDESIAGSLVFNEPFIADRKAHLEIVENNNKEVKLNEEKAKPVAVFEVSVLDRNNEEIEVKDKSFVVRIELSDEQYEQLVGREAYMVYTNDEGQEVERFEIRIVDGENGKKVLEFEPTHLSTFVLAYDDDTEESENVEIAISPDTGTVTAAGASAVSAALVTAIAVGILTSIASFTYLINRKY